MNKCGMNILDSDYNLVEIFQSVLSYVHDISTTQKNISAIAFSILHVFWILNNWPCSLNFALKEICVSKFIGGWQWFQISGEFLLKISKHLLSFAIHNCADHNFYGLPRSFWEIISRQMMGNGLHHFKFCDEVICDEVISLIDYYLNILFFKIISAGAPKTRWFPSRSNSERTIEH